MPLITIVQESDAGILHLIQQDTFIRFHFLGAIKMWPMQAREPVFFQLVSHTLQVAA